MPSNLKTKGAYSLEHRERDDIIVGEKFYIYVLQQVPKDFSPCHPFSTCLYFTLFFLLFFFSVFSLISLIADGPHHYRPACGH